MSAIDILILLAFAWGVVSGLRRGLIGQMASVAALVVALIGCRLFGGVLEPLFPVSPAFVAPILSNALVYIIIYAGVRFLAKGLKAVTHALLMGPIDRVLGAVFAVFKWLLGLSLVLNVWTAVFPDSEVVKRSRLGGGVAVETVMEIAPWLWGVVSESFADEPTNYSPQVLSDKTE